MSSLETTSDLSEELEGGHIDRKKLKKIMKRASKGECNSIQIFANSYAAGITGLPEVIRDEDTMRSRSEAAFGYDSSELRGLLASLLLGKEALPRALQLRNRFFVRNIAVLHFADWLDAGEGAGAGAGAGAGGYAALQRLVDEVNAERAQAQAATPGQDAGNPHASAAASTRPRMHTALHPVVGVRVAARGDKEIVSLQRRLLGIPSASAAEELGPAFAALVEQRDDGRGQGRGNASRQGGGKDKKRFKTLEGAAVAADVAVAVNVDAAGTGTGAGAATAAGSGDDPSPTPTPTPTPPLASEMDVSCYEPLVAPWGALQMWGFAWPADEQEAGLRAMYRPPPAREVEAEAEAGAEAGAGVEAQSAGLTAGAAAAAAAADEISTTNDPHPLPAVTPAAAAATASIPAPAPAAYFKDPALHDYGSCWRLVPAAEAALRLTAGKFGLRASFGEEIHDDYGTTYPQGSEEYQSLLQQLQQQQQQSASSLPPPPPLSLPRPLVAIDCEMVRTAAGAELARLSVVDGDGALLLDTFVRPQLPVIDYLTAYSGITPAVLDAHCSISLAQAQAGLQCIVSAETLVVGHSVDADMKALRLLHRRFLDTALLYPHPRGYPLRLKLSRLAGEHLGIDIQGRKSQRRQWAQGGRNDGATGALGVFMRASASASASASRHSQG
jgi:hypothetical protein